MTFSLVLTYLCYIRFSLRGVMFYRLRLLV